MLDKASFYMYNVTQNGYLRRGDILKNLVYHGQSGILEIKRLFLKFLNCSIIIRLLYVYGSILIILVLHV